MAPKEPAFRWIYRAYIIPRVRYNDYDGYIEKPSLGFLWIVAADRSQIVWAPGSSIC